MESKDIAVIGLAVRVPGADTPDAYWTNLSTGRNSIERLPNHNPIKPNHVPFAAFPDNLEFFDAAFFGMTPNEAELLDPQQRLLLECAWETFENAGYNPTSHAGKVGVYAGCALNTYLLCNLMPHPEYMEGTKLFQLILGSNPDFLATRISYKLNLRGPSQTIQSACSTSLVAVHLACRALHTLDCDMALVGGVALNLKLRDGYTYIDQSIFSVDGACRTFDADATGTVFGNGAGMVLLKPLANALKDGDSIAAIIRGSAVNNDGALKVGYTAPSIEGQADVIVEALRNANVHPDTISYVEAHGTGTPLGDPIEIAALARAYRHSTEQCGYCAIGSVKTNIGHLDAAAGVAGFIKTVLALKHRKIPPILHFRKANPQIDFSATPFYPNTTLMEWKTNHHPRRAGVSAFGIGGTNAHVILEEAPEQQVVPTLRTMHLIRLSARSEAALRTMASNLCKWLENDKGVTLADVAFTLQVGRKVHEYRWSTVCQNLGELTRQLAGIAVLRRMPIRHEERSDRQIMFLFPGQEALAVNAGRELYDSEEVFRFWMDRCFELHARETGQDLRQRLYPTNETALKDQESLQESGLAQPALFAVEYSLARLWIQWGVRPSAMLGYGLGEYAAACLSNVFTLEHGLRLVTARAQIVQESADAVMLVVYLDEAAAGSLLAHERSLSLIAINSYRQCVLAGDEEAIQRIEKRLTDEGIQSKRLNHRHLLPSSCTEYLLQRLRSVCKEISLSSPTIPIGSSVTGQWLTADQATNERYWTNHVFRTIHFQSILDLAIRQNHLFLEVGPGDMLTRLLRRHPYKASQHLEAFPTLEGSVSSIESLLNTAGDLWLRGVPVEPQPASSKERRQRVPLPTYPFERSRHWIDIASHAVGPNVEERSEQPNLANRPQSTHLNQPLLPHSRHL